MLWQYDIPKEHYSDINKVVLSDSDYGKGGNFAILLDGKTINLYLHSDIGTLIHEIGHNAELKYPYNKELFGKPPYVSKYAKTNASEDFAETYREYYIGNKCRLPALKLKCNQIKDL